MSFEAMTWAMNQPVTPAITKFVLVAMAECVNSSSGNMDCWPSYAHLQRRTGASINTVEASVYRLRQQGYIVDTGKREGGTGKVIVYRLNDPINGAVTPGPRVPTEDTSASGTRPQVTPNLGGLGNPEIPPNLTVNPPKSDGQSPQKEGQIPPDLGSGIRKEQGTGIRKGTRNGAAVAAIPGVPPVLFSEWMAVRKDKRAKTLTQTAVDGLLREAGKLGMTPEQAVRLCIERHWVGLNAGWTGAQAAAAPAQSGKHAGFATKDYRDGVSDDGSFH